MTVVTSFDLLEGESEHVTPHDQAGVVLPSETCVWSTDAAIGGNITVVADPAGGFAVQAIGACSGVLTLTAVRGSQQVVKTYPTVVTAALTDVVLQTP